VCGGGEVSVVDPGTKGVGLREDRCFDFFFVVGISIYLFICLFVCLFVYWWLIVSFIHSIIFIFIFFIFLFIYSLLLRHVAAQHTHKLYTKYTTSVLQVPPPVNSL